MDYKVLHSQKKSISVRYLQNEKRTTVLISSNKHATPNILRFTGRVDRWDNNVHIVPPNINSEKPCSQRRSVSFPSKFIFKGKGPYHTRGSPATQRGALPCPEGCHRYSCFRTCTSKTPERTRMPETTKGTKGKERKEERRTVGETVVASGAPTCISRTSSQVALEVHKPAVTVLLAPLLRVLYQWRLWYSISHKSPRPRPLFLLNPTQRLRTYLIVYLGVSTTHVNIPAN